MEHSFAEVYHASPVQGLMVIRPHVAVHGKPWVYATESIVMAALFLGRLGGDFTCATGAVNGTPYLCERFAGAFERRYGAVGGAIYALPGEGFMAGQTSCSFDLVCRDAVVPLREIRIENVREHLLRLASEGKLLLKRYPERYCVSPDDEDLVERAVRRYRRSGEEALAPVEQFHPGLMPRVRAAILEGRYSVGGK
jgi:hypothetical protein